MENISAPLIPEIIFPFFAAFIMTALAVPFSLPFIKRFGLIDNPSSHRHPGVIHTKPTPRGGGIPLFIGVFAAIFMFVAISPVVLMLFAASFLALIIGTLDDKVADLSRYFRFLMNILCALIVVASGITTPFITSPSGGIIHFDSIFFSFTLFNQLVAIRLSELVTILWIVWVMNMLNWSKGVDGQMPGIVGISAIIIGILSLRFPLTNDMTLLSTQLAFIIAGSAAGFLLFNFYPAKIFPGYGTTFLYMLLATVSVLASTKLATAVLVMGIPMIDGGFTILRRIATGRSPFWHDNLHLHHLLLKLGFGQRTIALFYWTISAILGLLALHLSSTGKLFAILLLVVIAGGALLFLHIILRPSSEKTDF